MTKSSITTAVIMENRKSVYIFNSFFWAKLETAGYVDGRLAKWTKHVGNTLA
jgi:Ulp1 family protease